MGRSVARLWAAPREGEEKVGPFSRKGRLGEAGLGRELRWGSLGSWGEAEEQPSESRA